MSFLNPDVIYTVLILVLPGILSQFVFNSLVIREKKPKVDIFQSILHSMFIYAIIYPLIITAWGHLNKNDSSNAGTDLTQRSIIELITYNNWAPIITFLVLTTASIIWGFIYSNIYKSEILKKILGKYSAAVEPPNLYAALLVPDYQVQDGVTKSHWITAKINEEKYIQGTVKMSAVTTPPREVYLTHVVYMDMDRNIIQELPEETGVILNLDECSLVEITEVTLED